MIQYYSVFGLPSDETVAGIQAAYRDMVRRADHALVPEWRSANIAALTRAFSVLSESPGRQLYDPSWVETVVEPAEETFAPESVISRPERVSPSYEGLLERL